jgi:uncharacterized membrane protein YqhA
MRFHVAEEVGRGLVLRGVAAAASARPTPSRLWVALSQGLRWRLIDVVMIANLLITVILGGYETFVSRLNLQGHPDQPEWLSHVNAGKLSEQMMLWQVIIHVTFVASAIALAWFDRLTFHAQEEPGHSVQ